METTLQDVRYALRTLIRSPGYTAVALLTLALGIGATTAMFTIVNGILLRPLPFPEPDALVRIYQASPERGLTRAEISPADFDDWHAQTRSFSGIAGYWSGTGILTGRGDASEVRSSYVTEDFFRVLGTPVQLGRPLGSDDLRQEARVAVISDGLWRSRFAADPGVLGSAMVLNGEPTTIVGVAAPSMRYPSATNDVWLPQSLLTEDSHGPRVRDNRHLDGIARLAPGVTVERAQADLTGVAARLAAEHPATNENWGTASVVQLREVMISDVSRALMIVLAVVAFVLLIGCANLANLMLARATGRSREIAIRAALGARKRRIVRQISTEAVVLATIGGMLGLVLSVWWVEATLRLSADTLPRLEEVGLDLRVVLFGIGVSLFTALLFGLLPAIRVVRRAPQESLRGGRGTVGASGGHLRDALVVTQVTMAVVLVVGAGLMARSFLELRGVNPGFDPDRVLTVALGLTVPPDLDPGEGTLFIIQRKEELEEQIGALPGVVAVGNIHRLPLRGEGEPLEFTGTGTSGEATSVRADARFVSPGYFQAMGIPLQSGELFDMRPVSEVPPILVSATTARRMWPGEEAVGRRMIAPWGGEVEVVGVVGDVRQLELADEPQPAIYMSQFQAPRTSTMLVVRTAGDPLALSGPIRTLIAEMDANQPIRSISSLGDILSESLARERFFTLLFGIFGTLALVLAALGIYGVLAYIVGQRRQEIGVRMALGARVGDVLAMVMRAGLVLVGTGVVLGLITALLVTRVLSGLLYNVSSTDPLTFVAVPALLTAVALLASYIPARRATRVDPMTALRSD